jgi:2-dehydropantoate 2-reductase
VKAAPNAAMNVAVMGAGAVGCYYGGMLARAGHEVTLIGRARHVDAVRRDGLFLDAQTFQSHVPMHASTEASAVRDADLVLFCVKSGDTESAGAAMAPYLNADAVVIGLQNGVDNAQRLQSVITQTVMPSVVYVASEMAGPGHVKHHGRGELVIGASPHSQRIAAAFALADVPVAISENVEGALWAKLILNCAYNALSAISKLPYGELVKGPGVTDVMADVVNECLAVAHADAVQLPNNVWEAVRQIAITMPTQFSSTAQDLARGKPGEIDHLNGFVVRRGFALGVATPVNRVLYTTVKLLERAQNVQSDAENVE